MKPGPADLIQAPSILTPARRIVAGLLPVSARRLARRIVGPKRVPSAAQEKRYDLNHMQAYERVLNHHGLSLRHFSSILDFACGSGRLTRYLPQLAPQAQLFGCDIESEAVAECRRGCPRGHFYTNDVTPPLQADDGQFDLIFSYSVFTSLSEPIHEAWLQELARKLSPAGVMLHTTHSYEYLTRAEMFCPEVLAKYDLSQTVEEFIQSAPGYYYVPYGPETPDYGLAIISKEYATAEWPRYTGLALVDYVEGAIEAYPEGCQDIVMLAKEGPRSL